MKRSLRKWYTRATDDQRARGITWYRDLRAWLCEQGDLTVSAYVFAALSPRIELDQNKRGCERMMQAARTGQGEPMCAGTSVNRAKAWRIATTGDLSNLRGPKVTAFADNLANPDSEQLTVDAWAIRAYHDDHTMTAYTPTPKQYETIKQAYLAGARQVGLHPVEFQAVVWNAIREWSKA